MEQYHKAVSQCRGRLLGYLLPYWKSAANTVQLHSEDNIIPSSTNRFLWPTFYGLFYIYISTAFFWLPAVNNTANCHSEQHFLAETSLSAIIYIQFYSVLALLFLLLRCHPAFSARILFFLWFHYFSKPFSFAYFLTLCLSLESLFAGFQPSLSGTYFFVAVSRVCLRCQSATEFPGEVCNRAKKNTALGLFPRIQSPFLPASFKVSL